jgi:alpha-tubulin suppressor-like RCC1 family protein
MMRGCASQVNDWCTLACVPPNGRPYAPILGFALCVVCACSPRPTSPLGSDCELSNQCAVPLVCRLGRCREECRSTRDCRAGLVCFRGDGLGACELAGETCVLSSDCPDPLVCVMGACANACATDADCPAETYCFHDPADPELILGCRPAPRCELNTDCMGDRVCGPGGICQAECMGPRDCRDGTVCDTTRSPAVCVWPTIDAGSDASVDGGAIDAAMLDSAMLDAPSTDTGASDTGSLVDAFAMTDAGVVTGPAPPPVLAGGERHTCGVHAGQLRCWGASTTGELGDGTMADHHVSAPVMTVSGATTTLVAAGLHHACASDATGLYCWGENARGQIGNGGTSASVPGPVRIPGATTTSIAAGDFHTCAIRGGVVECWGDNALGQLGDGGVMPHSSPTPTVALAGLPLELSARGEETCALLVDGRVQCWGQNADGELGNGTTTTGATSTPQLVLSLVDAVEVTVGAAHACARRRGGEVLCWGSNVLGALGDGSPTGLFHRATPGPVSGLAPAAEIAAGLGHVCARALDGSIACWGENTNGQVGVNNLVAMPYATTPVTVLGVSGATELATGESHTCARVALGLRCWGANSFGQLGDGSTSESYMPVPVSWP